MTDERENQIRAVRNQDKKKHRSAQQELSGHEKYLNALERSKAKVIVTTARGAEFVGRVKHSDKFTVSMECEDFTVPGRTFTKVFFKANIESFVPEPPQSNEVDLASH